ncbi:unnamed protein product [Bursaphelenchus okinawaensis]|uniref:Uncharacterized protein n=1 Tax=Bursaphelenchus okinawaensis TaxID=465554 RepID=A0A811KBK6_9BILA|nr:unnamed protein product [Bursaphelenchus okinawaensis]CAG9095527.1 unnamed protein product [Bursaphelenchus okinawaensis]
MGCPRSSATALCVTGEFICEEMISYKEMNLLTITAYQLASDYYYEILGQTTSMISRIFYLPLNRTSTKHPIIISLDINYCADNYRKVDLNVTTEVFEKFQRLYEPVNLGKIRMEDLMLDDYNKILLEELMVADDDREEL